MLHHFDRSMPQYAVAPQYTAARRKRQRMRHTAPQRSAYVVNSTF